MLGGDPHRSSRAGVGTKVGTTPRSTHFVRSLRRALEVDAQGEIEFAVNVAVLLALDHSRGEIAAKLDASAREVRAAIERLRRVARRRSSSSARR
jgi:hypothetical protein